MVSHHSTKFEDKKHCDSEGMFLVIQGLKILHAFT